MEKTKEWLNLEGSVRGHVQLAIYIALNKRAVGDLSIESIFTDKDIECYVLEIMEYFKDYLKK